MEFLHTGIWKPVVFYLILPPGISGSFLFPYVVFLRILFDAQSLTSYKTVSHDKFRGSVSITMHNTVSM